MTGPPGPDGLTGPPGPEFRGGTQRYNITGNGTGKHNGKTKRETAEKDEK